MFTKETIIKNTKEVVNTPAFQAYLERAKTNDYYRTNSPVHFTLEKPNSHQLVSYIVQLAQDKKRVKVIEQGKYYNREWGYLDLEELTKKKRVTRTRTTKAKTAKETKD